MEGMQYELARNMTLLFFFERLLDKGEPRTLHDLSCQFGSKGFTREMRQIAGGSQSGLRKFLTQYPALFCIDGDYVNVNMFQNSPSSNSRNQKDYAAQAVDYFSEKLAQYGGEGTEVPIRSLLGHRSQASPEVRHVSGQHFHEFRDFLAKHCDSFIVDDEKEVVLLKDFKDLKVGDGTQELNFPMQVKVDPEMTQKLLDFFAQCIEVKGPILVEQLFQIVSCNLPEEMWSNLFNTPALLTSFLRLFSDSFHIQSNLVTLLQTPKVFNNNNQQKLNSIDTQNQYNQKKPVVEQLPVLTSPKKEVAVVKEISGNTSPGVIFELGRRSPTDVRMASPLKGSSIGDRLRQPKLQQQRLNEELNNRANQEKNEQQNYQMNLSLSPPRIRSSPTSPQPSLTTQPPLPHIPSNNKSPPITQQPSPPSLTPTNTTTTSSNQQQSLKQRINTLVLKTIQANTGRDKGLFQQQLDSGNNREQWKMRLLQNTRVVCNVKECQMVVRELTQGVGASRRAGKGQQQNGTTNFSSNESWPFTPDKTVIGFDCEGINLGFNGQITLMQMATVDGCAYIFDLISCPEMIQAGLKALLENPNIIKVIHDCRNDAANLYRQFDITLCSVFDTQAAHAVLTFQETGKPVYKTKNISLNAMCSLYEAPTNPMKEQLKNVYRRDQRYWSRRPLTKEMMLYASADVLCLINDKFYPGMAAGIQEDHRELAMELFYEQVYLQINPDAVKLTKRQRKTETEVSELRQKLAKSTKSIVLSNREVRLLRYFELTDEEKDKLKSSAKVAKKLEKLESLGQDKDNQSTSTSSDNENDFPSIDSTDNNISPRNNSEPTSLTESMQLVDCILSDNRIDRLDKIERLESILTAAALLPTEQDGGVICQCNCHHNAKGGPVIEGRVISPTHRFVSGKGDLQPLEGRVNVEAQTLSTGDIVVTKIFFDEQKNG